MLTDSELSILRLTDSYSQQYYFDALSNGLIKHGSHGLDHWRYRDAYRDIWS